jgi:transposase
MGKQVGVSVPQRCEAVLKLLRREEPAAQIARRLGVSEPTLYRWRDEFISAGQAALGSGKGAGDRRERQVKELRQELDQRDQVIGELTIANRILKKTSEGLL